MHPGLLLRGFCECSGCRSGSDDGTNTGGGDRRRGRGEFFSHRSRGALQLHLLAATPALERVEETHRECGRLDAGTCGEGKAQHQRRTIPRKNAEISIQK